MPDCWGAPESWLVVSASGSFVESLRDLLEGALAVRAKVQDPKGLDKRGVPDRTSAISYGTTSGLKVAKWLYAEAAEEVRSDRKYALLTKYLGVT